jgi:poly(hydroxyalkanoate) depolymerase family esterase
MPISRTPRRVLTATAGLVLLAAGITVAPDRAGPAAAARAAAVVPAAANPGNLELIRHVPPGLPRGRPLVVVLHGCTQAAVPFAGNTGWRRLADRWRFALLMPQQRSANNIQKCFNWFQTEDIRRGSGEAASIREMVATMVAGHGVDPGRVYVTGLSAGGAMAAVMLAAYPDVFAGGAVVAGLPYGCATTVLQAFTCMSPGVDRTPAQWGDAVRRASPAGGPWPVVSLWHGTSDTTVVPRNLAELVEQWTNVHGASAGPADTVGGYPHRLYRDRAGRAVVESYQITGAQHGQAVDPGAGTAQCGTAAPYILDVNVCAAFHIGRFWDLDR